MNPIAVKGLIINATGEILIFKRAEQEGLEGKYKGFLDLPGGGAKRESARFAMARELAEEAGIYMDPESLPKSKITNIYVDEYAMEVELHLFKIQLDHTPYIEISSEHSLYEWMPQGRLLQLLFGEGDIDEATNEQKEKILPFLIEPMQQVFEKISNEGDTGKGDELSIGGMY